MDLGINLWGADQLQNGHYLFPTDADIDYFAAKGFTNIRLPFNWEDIQPKLNGPLDASYVAQIQQVVDYARERGIDVILDVHNYGSYNGNLIGSSSVSVASFADLWGKIATAFAGDSNVRFDLMNEPQLDATTWLKAANSAIAAIRHAGANQEVLVPGVHWDGAWSWTSTDNDDVIGKPGAIVDPAHNFAFEVHQYLDDTSGQHDWVVSETIGVERLEAITDWARASGVKLYLGEFGVADNAQSLAALDNMLEYLSKNQDVWQSASYWVAGQSNPDYMYSVEPDFGLLDAPQMAVLDNYTDQKVVETHLSDGTIRRDFYVGGESVPAMSDIATSKGVLVSRTLFDAEGDKRSQAVVAADGSITVTSYSDPGQPYPYVSTVYNADHEMIGRTTADNTGADIVEYFHAGDTSAYRQDSIDSKGALVYILLNDAGSHNFTNYSGGKITSQTTYNAAWKLIERRAFDAQGRLSQIQEDHTDGTHTVKQVNVLTGKVSSSIDYSAQWAAVSNTTYDSSENPVTRTTKLADGTREIDYYVKGQSVLDHSDVMSADNKLASRVTYTADGYTTDVYSAPGSSRLVQTTVCKQSGQVVSLTEYDANGKIATVEHYNADGGYSQAHYSPAGQPYPATVDVYNANNKLVSHAEYDAAGNAVTIDTVGADGSQTIQYFVAGTAQLAKVEVFDASGHMQSRAVYDATGLLATISRYGADGTHTVENYDAAHQDHATTINFYDANNKLASVTTLDADGKVSSVDALGADGSHTVRFYVAGTNTVSRIDYLDLNGHLLSSTSYDQQGLVTKVRHDNADGTHAVNNFDASHQAQPVSIDVFDASWKMLSHTQYDDGGHILSRQTFAADGTRTVETYVAGSDHLATVSVYDAGGALDRLTTYDANGLISTDKRVNADGSYTLDTYISGGQAYVATTDIFDASGKLTSRTSFDASGKTVQTDTVGQDGTHTIRHFDASGAIASLEVYSGGMQLQSRVTYGADHLIKTIQHQNADGTQTVENYDAAHQLHPASADKLDASGKLINYTQFDDQGYIKVVETVLANGKHVFDNYAPGTNQVANTGVYTAKGALESRTTYDNNGRITKVQHENSDGSHSVDNYSTSANIVTSIDKFDASWKMISRSQVDSKGNITGVDTLLAGGKHSIVAYVAGTTIIATSAIFTADGHLESRTTYDAKGLITKIQRDNADGTHTLETYTAADQHHAAYVDNFTSGWTMINRSYYTDSDTVTTVNSRSTTGGLHLRDPGETHLTNTSVITGQGYAIQDGEGALHFVNKGTIRGDVDLGGGDDVFDIRSGKFSGVVHGGDGNDIYQVSSAKVRIVETANGGHDSVESTVSLTLRANIENLNLLGAKDISGKGNSLDNWIVGNKGDNHLSGLAGSDTLWGGGGKDVLTGGAGDDTFMFRTNSGTETVTDFKHGADHIAVDFIHSLSDVVDLLDNNTRQHGDDVVITHGSDRLVLEHMHVNQIGVEDFALL